MMWSKFFFFFSPPPPSLFFSLLQTSCSVYCWNLICVAGVPGGQHGAVQPFSDEDASVETLSHCSSFSDSTSVAEEGWCVLCTSVSPGLSNFVIVGINAKSICNMCSAIYRAACNLFFFSKLLHVTSEHAFSQSALRCKREYS